MNRKLGIVAAALALMIGVIAPAQDTRESLPVRADLADLVRAGEGMAWIPLVPNDGFSLRIGTPTGEVLQKTFPAWETPTLDTRELGIDAEDGSYRWELRIIPRVDGAMRGEMLRAREEGDERTLRRLLLEVRGGLPPAQSGSFRVAGGSIRIPDESSQEEPGGDLSSTQAYGYSDRTEDQVILDDLIVDGSACIGNSCINGMEFGFDTLVFRESNLRIFFDDDGMAPGYPSNDWRIVVNDTTDGGDSYLGIEDASMGRMVFKVMAGAPESAIHVDDYGDVGFGTSVPAKDLHLMSGNTPTIRFDQQGGGWPDWIWDVAAHEMYFALLDVTSGDLRPFKVYTGAPNNSMIIDPEGDVGLGVYDPLHPNFTHKLHVEGDAYVTGAFFDSGDNAGTAEQVLTSTVTGTAWADAPSGTDPVIGNEVADAADGTLTRSGGGTAGDPYQLALNLGSANTWSTQQTFGNARVDGVLLDGTGAAGTGGQALLSSGAGISWGDLPDDPDPVIGNEVADAADGTLSRTGGGTVGDPYQLALNLGSVNIWSAQQTFGAARLTGTLFDASNSPGTNGQVLVSNGSGISWDTMVFPPDGDWTVAGGDMYAGVPGNVGIGTTAPGAPLHVRRTDGSALLLVEEVGAAGPLELLRLESNGPVGLNLTDTSAGSWVLYNDSGTLVANNAAGPASPKFSLEGNGNLTISGILTQGCSREIKENFDALDGGEVLARLAGLPMLEWSYIADPARHAGPIAEEFHAVFGLGGDKKRLAPSDLAGVALAAVQELQRRNETLQRENQELEARLAALERVVSDLANGSGTP